MLQYIFVIIIYIFIVFILSRFVVPHLGFKDDKLSENITEDMREVINGLKSRANSKEEFLKLAYNYLGSRFRSERFNTFLKFHYLFKNLDDIWKMQGYMPCTQSSFLMRIFLIKSGFFKEEEVRKRHTFFDFNIHQYLQVNLGGKWVDIDIGEKQRGMPIGKRLKYFGL